MIDPAVPELRLTAGSHDSIPAIMSRLHEVRSGSVIVVIPAESPLLLTASEFQALRSEADASGVQIRIETTDRLRRHLASMFGMPIVEPVSERPEEATPPWERSAPSSPDAARQSEPSDDARRRPPVKLIAMGVGGLVVAVVVAVGILLLTRSATVTVTTVRQPVTASTSFVVVGPGAVPPQGGSFTLTAEQASWEVSFTVRVPATGGERQPVTNAAGELQLRNMGGTPVTIPNGFGFTGKDGFGYQFTQDVTVPAASGGSPGEANATVAALAGGEKGNHPAGTFSGQLDNGVYYMNRNNAFSGGVDQVTLQVAQADIDNLIAQANDQLPDLARTQALPDSRLPIPGSVSLGAPAYSVDHQVGEVADTVAIKATIQASGLVFSAANAKTQAAATLRDQLAAAAPANTVLDDASIELGTPAVQQDGPAAAIFTIPATAGARPLLTKEQRNAIAENVAGKSVAEAEAWLAQQPYIASSRFSFSPAFLPKKIPGSAGKITVNET